MLMINEKVSIPLKEFQFSFARSPGPGGQNVNKVNTKVLLKWKIAESAALPEDIKERAIQKFARRISKSGELIVTSHRFRDQGRNVADALNKLRELISAVAEKPKSRKKTKPSKGSKMRRLENKKRLSSKKQSRKTPQIDQ